MTALISCEHPRFSERHIELGAFDAEGPLLVLSGAWAPLFELLAGSVELGGGVIRIAGVEAAGAVALGRIGLCRARAVFPASWTVGELLRESARLLGHGRRSAADAALEVAAQLELGDLLARKLSTLGPGQQRAAAVAVAAVGEPLALALEEPFEGLPPSGQAYLARVLELALARRPVIFSVPALPGDPERDALVRSASEVLFLGPRGLAARGRLSELLAGSRAYRVLTLTAAGPLLSPLVEAGYEVRGVTSADETSLTVVDSNGRGTGPMFEAALAAGVPIVELYPLTAAPENAGGADSV